MCVFLLVVSEGRRPRKSLSKNGKRRKHKWSTPRPQTPFAFTTSEYMYVRPGGLKIVDTGVDKYALNTQLVAKVEASVWSAFSLEEPSLHVAIKFIHDCQNRATIRSEFETAKSVGEFGFPFLKVFWISPKISFSSCQFCNFAYQANACAGRHVQIMVQQLAVGSDEHTSVLNRGIGGLDLVEKLHATGIVHGDLHWGNLVGFGNGWTLIDFGAAGPPNDWNGPYVAPEYSTIWQLEKTSRTFRDDIYRFLEEMAKILCGETLHAKYRDVTKKAAKRVAVLKIKLSLNFFKADSCPIWVHKLAHVWEYIVLLNEHAVIDYAWIRTQLKLVDDSLTPKGCLA